MQDVEQAPQPFLSLAFGSLFGRKSARPSPRRECLHLLAVAIGKLQLEQGASRGRRIEFNGALPNGGINSSQG
jgi:hypothetical protein